MKKLVSLAALAFALAASVPQHAFACEQEVLACSTPGCGATPTPANSAAKGDRLDTVPSQPATKAPAAVACSGGSGCATPEPEPTQVATIPKGDHPPRAAASMSPAGAALGKAAKAIKDRVKQRADCQGGC